MKKRVITGIIFTIAVAGFILPGYNIPQLPLLFFFLVAAICIIEVSTVVKVKLNHVNQPIAVVGSLCVFAPVITILIHGDLGWRLIMDYSNVSPNKLITEQAVILRYVTESISYLFLMLVLFAGFSVFYTIIKKGPSVLMDAVSVPLIAGYVVVPIVCALILLFAIPNGYLWMIAAMTTAWISDVFAYFTGVTLGKHKIIPQISPKKTWEGCVGGILGSIFIMTIWFSVFMNGADIVERSVVYRIAFGVTIGLLTSIISQFGDWFASAIKRWSGTKDFGNFLPGQCGLMDRFDGMFFSFPTMLVGALIYYLT